LACRPAPKWPFHELHLGLQLLLLPTPAVRIKEPIRIHDVVPLNPKNFRGNPIPEKNDLSLRLAFTKPAASAGALYGLA
jgi:hypothetical protein